MTSLWFDLGLTLKTLNLFFLRLIEQSGSENHVYRYLCSFLFFSFLSLLRFFGVLQICFGFKNNFFLNTNFILAKSWISAGIYGNRPKWPEIFSKWNRVGYCSSLSKNTLDKISGVATAHTHTHIYIWQFLFNNKIRWW